MKKTFLAAFASLILAGAISAATGLDINSHTPGEIVLAGDGTSPVSMPVAQAPGSGDVASRNK